VGLVPDPLVTPAKRPLNFLIRDLTSAELDGVMAIEEASFPTAWSRALFEEEIGRRFSDAIVVVGEPGGTVDGYAICWTTGEESHLLNIAVRPDARKKGIGRSLLRECIRRSMLAGGRRIFLEVRPTSQEAIRLYEKEGFRAVGIRRGYYTDTGEDAIVFARETGEMDDV
jgi:ribosomal-protein-alanine N-acetyltransferase